jgi:hypothetical protein
MMPKNRTIAAVQPKAGEAYLHCGHVNPAGDFHTWIAPCKFVRPDGTIGETRWLVCCDSCLKRAGGKGTKIEVRGEATWTGDEPPIVKTSSRSTGKGLPSAEMATLDSWPGLTSALTTAAARFGTNNLVVLAANQPKQGRLIRRDLFAGNFPAERLPGSGKHAGFIVTVSTAADLLRTHCGEGGGFVANHLEERASLQECWTVTAGGNWVDACAYRQLKATFFTASDVRGKEQYAEAVHGD